MSRKDAQKIDLEKLRIEATITPKFKTIFNNIARDAERLYKTTGKLPSQELAQNYYPEFVKEIRDAMRKTIKFFGFDLRKALELKGFNFDAEFKSGFIDLEKKLKIIDENLDPKLEDINNEFLRNATLFIANQSEVQADYITQTNAKELALAALQEETAYLSNQKANEIWAIIAKNLFINLLDRRDGRVDLISSQVVGLAEAWSRQEEARLINQAELQSQNKPVRVLKTWWAILSSKTRASHVEADQQQVGVDELFYVGGASAMYPRDPNLPARESSNCRCVSVNSV